MLKQILKTLPRLTDAQFIALSQAAQRDDRRVTPSATLRGAAVRRFLDAQLNKGLIEAAVGRTGDGAPEVPVHVISSLGLQALGIDAAGVAPIGPVEAECLETLRADDPMLADRDVTASDGPEEEFAHHLDGEDREGKTTDVSAGPRSPRTASKLAQVIEMLERPGGSTIGEVMATTGWLPHTTRAALTGLRKRGYALERLRGEDAAESRYRIAAAASSAVEA